MVLQQKRHLDSKASCSESRLFSIRVANLPLFECALYRQTEQKRHFRWRGWMLRPRVIRPPTNPKWDRSRIPTSRSVLFLLFILSSLFFFFFVCLFAKRLLSISLLVNMKCSSQKHWRLPRKANSLGSESDTPAR